MGPGAGVSQRDAGAGNFFGRQDPEKMKNRKKKKKKAMKGGTGGVVSMTADASSSALAKRNCFDGSTARDRKKVK